jgi:putative ABC transport system ATP-binding protein
MIELKQITKTFNAGRANEFTALRQVDLVIDANRVTVLKGPSGSGKTTLLSIIGCMSRPTSGRIQLKDREITSLPERFATEIRRSTFGFVFQNYNLIKGLTTLENTMIPAFPEGPDHRQLVKQAVGLLENLGLADKIRQKVEHLSGGEQQRTAIARALINDPQVVIADEPTAHLDTELAETFISIVARLKQEGRTILMASHDPVVYRSEVVDRVVEMRDGRVKSLTERAEGTEKSHLL